MAKIEVEEVQRSPESEAFRNLSEDLSKAELEKIGEEVVDGFERDRDSLSGLLNTQREYNKLFNMVHEVKNDPWENAANVKLPIIITACTNFWARAYGNLFPANGRIVRGLPIDSRQETIERGTRIQRHMNWQIQTMPEFNSGMSKTLMMLPKDGFAFRKTYWDSNLQMVNSSYVAPQDFVVNYYTKDLISSMRYTQILRISVNEIKLKGVQGIYINTDEITEDTTTEPELDSTTINNKKDSGQEQPSEVDYATPREILEVHLFIYRG